MSEIQHDVVIAAFPSNLGYKIEDWLLTIGETKARGFVFIGGGGINGDAQCVLRSCGSKVGWDAYQTHLELCKEFTDFLDSQAYNDGSNSFKYIAVGFGDVAQHIITGNSKTIDLTNYYSGVFNAVQD